MGLGYPIVLDLSGRLVVVVGGGRVGLRKTRGLLESGAGRVRVVSLAFRPEMPDAIERIVEPYRAEHLHGAALVIAATDVTEVNDSIVRDARAIGTLVCRADGDDDLAGDFITPAMWRSGPLLMTISSGGSPAFSAQLRDRLAAAIDPRWAAMAQAMIQLRPMIRQTLAPARRREAFMQLCTDAAMDELSQGGVERLEAWLRDRFPELTT